MSTCETKEILKYTPNERMVVCYFLIVNKDEDCVEN